MSLNYRRDNRTVEEFYKDIQEGSKIEREIIDLYVDLIERETGNVLTVEDNGIDNSGKLIQGKVNSNADYLIDGKPIEVKYCRPINPVFRLKESQVKSYIKQKARVLMVMGWDSPGPVFTILQLSTLERIQEKIKPQPFFPWGNKMTYVLNVDWFKWKPLKEVNKH